MKKPIKNYKWKLFLFFLFLCACSIWLAVLEFKPGKLSVIACDVGQGDAILIIQGIDQVLIDGGPNNKVIDCLSKHVPFWDRKIELVVLTHPQADHSTGLLEVFKRYEVETFLANSLESSSQGYQVLTSLVGGRGITVVTPEDVQSARVGLIHLDILHPTKEFITANSSSLSPSLSTVASNNNASNVLGTTTSKLDSNEFSIVLLATYKDFKVLLTGDIETRLSDFLSLKSLVLSSSPLNYIKIPHHGSINGITPKLLDAAKPEIAVISVGKNSYGHPSQETLKIIKDRNIKILRTDIDGDVIVSTDGNKWWID